jgi:hypothetical protein
MLHLLTNARSVFQGSRFSSASPILVLMSRTFIAVALALSLLGLLTRVHAYSVLSHKALIDAGWETGIRHLL